jgi:hypothetical protein
MSAAVVQLVARGPQDEYLTGNPQTSFFKQKFTRYTPFSSTMIRQNIEGNPAPGGISTIKIDKKSDLLSYCYLTALSSTGLVPYINWGSIIDKVELLIGGQVIDEQDTVWTSNIEPVVCGTCPSQARLPLGVPGTSSGYNSNSFYPLKFFFCKNWASALPLVALQFHEVTIRITWSPTFTARSYQYVLWMKSIFVADTERQMIAKTPTTMLITQIQRQRINKIDPFMDVIFSNPVKFLAFESNNYVTSYNSGLALQMKIQVNGVDGSDFMSLLQWVDVPQYYHTPVGYSSSVPNIAIIPFCLNTALIQPTGSLNISRLDRFRLVTPDSQKIGLLTNPNTTYMYAMSYNFLKIENGLGSLLYLI